MLVEAGSTLVVSEGALRLRYPFASLAERLVAVEVPLGAEEACCLQESGWIELVVTKSTKVLILSPESAGLLVQGRRYLERVIATVGRRCSSGDAGDDARHPEPGAGAEPSLPERSSMA